MNILRKRKSLKTLLENLKKIRDYIQGNARYHFYYFNDGQFRWLIRQHIIEQFEFRLQLMDKECYNEGQCKICGCKTTALQFANKACDKPCYPPMMNYPDWILFKLIDLKSKFLKKVYKGDMQQYFMDVYVFMKEGSSKNLDERIRKANSTTNELLYNK